MINTGDGLFDVYANLVWDRYDAGVKEYAAFWRAHPGEEGQEISRSQRQAGEIDEFSQLPCLNPAVLDGLEPQFGGDPRYWQLCSWNIQRWRGEEQTGYSMFYPAHYRYILEARSRGFSDATLLLMLAPVYEKASEKFLETGAQMICGYHEFSTEERNTAAKEIAQAEVEDIHHTAAELVQQIGMSEAELYEEVTRLEPDASGSWYSLGMYYAKLGDMETALGYIRRGNSSPRLERFVPYPLETVSLLHQDCTSPELTSVLGMFWLALSHPEGAESRGHAAATLRIEQQNVTDSAKRLAHACAWLKMIVRDALLARLGQHSCQLRLLTAALIADSIIRKHWEQFDPETGNRYLAVANEAKNYVHDLSRRDSIRMTEMIVADETDETSGQLSDNEMLQQFRKRYDNHALRWRNELQQVQTEMYPLLERLAELDLENTIKS